VPPKKKKKKKKESSVVPLPFVGAMVGFGLVGAALTRGKNKPCKNKQHKACFRGTNSRGPVDCEAMPWLPEQVDAVITEQWDAGVRDAWHLGLAALRTVYPETPGDEPRPIRWPSITADCPEVKLMEQRVMLRANRICSTLDDELADAEWYESGGY
jgi:hypothetical protein